MGPKSLKGEGGQENEHIIQEIVILSAVWQIPGLEINFTVLSVAAQVFSFLIYPTIGLT